MQNTKMPLTDAHKGATIHANMRDMDVMASDWRKWPDDKRLSVRDVAWMLRVGCQRVRKLIRGGRLTARREGHIYKIPVICLKKYLDRQKEIRTLSCAGKTTEKGKQ